MRSITSLALACLLAGIPFAASPQAADEPIAPAPLDEQPSEIEETRATPPAAPVEGQIVLQDENAILANDLIGTTVYSPTDESVGDINDMIVDLDGTVTGVVIGVGGFLGIGEKHVAIEMTRLTLTTDDSGDPRLILNASREELELAQPFITAAQQRREAEAVRIQQEAASGALAPTAPVEN